MTRDEPGTVAPARRRRLVLELMDRVEGLRSTAGQCVADLADIETIEQAAARILGRSPSAERGAWWCPCCTVSAGNPGSSEPYRCRCGLDAVFVEDDSRGRVGT